MSQLSFMDRFPWGEPTNFRRKIIISGLEKEKTLMGTAYKLPSPDGKTYQSIFCEDEPKIHTIRKSPYLTRFVGKPIKMYNWVGTPYKKGSSHDVFKTTILDGYQQFDINFLSKGYFTISIDRLVKCVYQVITTENELGTSRELRLDAVMGGFEFGALAINDGFLNNMHFLKYFDRDFKGYMYHWTNLRY